MSAPIRSQIEIDLILNKGNNAICDLGYDVMEDAKRGSDLSDTDFRDKVYRLILLRSYLKQITDPNTGDFKAYYESSTNEKKFNIMLDAIIQLSMMFDGPGIPLIRGTRLPVTFYPSTSGISSSGGGTGGPANPGGVTFENLDVDSPGEIVDTVDASLTNYAFYLINVMGTNPGEGSRLDVITVNWLGSNDPVITNYRGNDVGGITTGVSFSAAIVSGQMELTCNVPSDNWRVRGTRISFQNISFQNTIGPLPSGGTVGQYLRKNSSTDYDASFAAIAISEITGLSTSLASFLLLAGGTMSGAIAMGSNKITGLAAGTTNGDALRYEQVIGLFLLLTGGTMSGNIAMGSNKITGLAAASGNGEALRYEQLINLYMLLTGGTMSGDIAMGGNKVTGLAAASGNGEAVRYEQLTAFVPAGMIVMWAGTSAPTGWHLCDGTGGTPNLKSKFIVGYDAGDPDYSSIGNTGGEKTHLLTGAESGQKSVSFPSLEIGSSTQWQGGVTSGLNSITQTLGPSDAASAHENRPPYYTLAYIMKL